MDRITTDIMDELQGIDFKGEFGDLKAEQHGELHEMAARLLIKADATGRAPGYRLFLKMKKRLDIQEMSHEE